MLRIGNAVQLRGGWNEAFQAQSGFTVIDAEGVRNGIWIVTAVDVSIQRFTVQNGLYGINSWAANLFLDSCRIIGSTGSQDGMTPGTGIYVLEYRNLYLKNCSVNGNSTGILNSGGTVTLVNSTVSENHNPQDYYGGIFSNGKLNIYSSTISDNSPKGISTFTDPSSENTSIYQFDPGGERNRLFWQDRFTWL